MILTKEEEHFMHKSKLFVSEIGIWNNSCLLFSDGLFTAKNYTGKFYIFNRNTSYKTVNYLH